MSLRSAAEYHFGLTFTRFMPLNGDLTIPTPTRMFGGVGPFDFSGVANIAAVALTVKLDTVATSIVVDLSAAVSAAAVTVAELVTALTTQATPALSTLSITASSGTGKNGSTRIKLESTDTATTPTYIQVYSELATIAGFGQGLGLKFIKSDTLKTAEFTPILKEAQDFTTTDGQGRDTEVHTDSYPKGISGPLVDAAKDPAIKVLMLGGSLNATTGRFEAGTSESTRYYFYMEMYFTYYSEGDNLEANIAGYRQKTIRNAVGSVGAESLGYEWSDGNYTISGLTYKDENGVLWGAEYEDPLTESEYAALNLLTV